MEIKKIKICNYRGIKALSWDLPEGIRHFCLIGKGDSTKTTILNAIHLLFYPYWNPTFNDSDFYLGENENPIEISAIIGNLSSEFLSRYNFGDYLHGWNRSSRRLNKEPLDGDEEVVAVKLIIDKDLQPEWWVLNHELELGVLFKQTARSHCNVSFIGNYSDRNFSWGRGSVLTSFTEHDDLDDMLAEITRVASNAVEERRTEGSLKKFDETSLRVQSIAEEVGIHVNENYQPRLTQTSLHIGQGMLSIHDGKVPLAQLGLGSRRILICGLQKELLEQSHITLIDEIEFGLEPHRINRLLKSIKSDDSGQYFFTSHSPIVLRELTIRDLYIVRSNGGQTDITLIDENEKFQGPLRKNAEAFLAEKIIICEGATEVGLCRGLDNYWVSNGDYSFAYYGVATLDAGGASNIRNLAETMLELGYVVSVLADNDAPKHFSKNDAEELQNMGVSVFMWDDNNSTEVQLFNDISWQCVQQSVLFIKDEKPVIDNIKSKLNGPICNEIMEWSESDILRQAIGKAAKCSGWYKRISYGEDLGELVAQDLFCEGSRDTTLKMIICDLHLWIKNE